MTTMTEFEFSNPFSSIGVRALHEKDTWNEWAEAHFEQGFCPRPSSVSFATTTDEDYSVIVDQSDNQEIPSECVFAVRLPLANFGEVLCIRGGYTDIDIHLEYPPESVLFMELPGEKLVIRLGRLGCKSVDLLRPNDLYPRSTDFSLDADVL